MAGSSSTARRATLGKKSSVACPRRRSSDREQRQVDPRTPAPRWGSALWHRGRTHARHRPFGVTSSTRSLIRNPAPATNAFETNGPSGAAFLFRPILSSHRARISIRTCGLVAGRPRHSPAAHPKTAAQAIPSPARPYGRVTEHASGGNRRATRGGARSAATTRIGRSRIAVTLQRFQLRLLRIARK